MGRNGLVRCGCLESRCLRNGRLRFFGLSLSESLVGDHRCKCEAHGSPTFVECVGIVESNLAVRPSTFCGSREMNRDARRTVTRVQEGDEARVLVRGSRKKCVIRVAWSSCLHDDVRVAPERRDKRLLDRARKGTTVV